MAVGDSVVHFALSVPASTQSFYQPAAGVEVMVLSFGGNSLGTWYFQMYNGASGAAASITEASSSTSLNPYNTKIIIDNSNYFAGSNQAGSAKNMFMTGIQIK